ncbi:DinB family protein [Gorillibacterium sp. sgz500922]|uniref:DinB family protein n=1 Tax=Gorillibacterium sp. sgz500922 TaxID=3446694 RepID=UPI003F68214B
MNQEQWLGQLRLVRSITLRAMDGLTEELADLQPLGFSNTIRWQFGHILTVQETVVTHFAGDPPLLDPALFRLFANGTRPADWKQPPPPLSELYRLLEEQGEAIRRIYVPRWGEPAVKPFRRLGHPLHTIGELFAFSLHHEGIHVGQISCLRKAAELAAAGRSESGEALGAAIE